MVGPTGGASPGTDGPVDGTDVPPGSGVPAGSWVPEGSWVAIGGPGTTTPEPVIFGEGPTTEPTRAASRRRAALASCLACFRAAFLDWLRPCPWPPACAGVEADLPPPC